MGTTALLAGDSSDFGLVGDSPQIQLVLELIRKLKHDASPVLITGESGVGKELVARAVHACSPLAQKLFLPVDSASLVGGLMESELFGHVKGAFTGAVDHKPGLVSAAEGGTLFLDEIGELDPSVQAKLLRLVQEQEIRPIGAVRPIKVNVRIVAATNRNLEEAVKSGWFRKDLYYRLKVISIEVPPLRKRRSDIRLLVDHFTSKYSPLPVPMSENVVDRLAAYNWPGNVRQLENVIRRVVALKSSSEVQIRDLPTTLRDSNGADENLLDDDRILPLAEVEKRYIFKALQFTNNDIQTAAAMLGIGKTTLYRKIKAYREDEERRKDPQRKLAF